MDYTNGKNLLNILKPKSRDSPIFGEIPFDEIVLSGLKSSLDVSPSAEPKVLILCGPPGCGKSTIKKMLLSQNSIADYINIDPDVIREILMSKGVTFPDDKTMTGITNTFNKRISDEAQKQRFNIVFDTTGQNFKAISDLIRNSRGIGYKTYFTIVWASLETCLRRVEGRNQQLREIPTGRIELPIPVAESIYNGFMQQKGTASMFLLDYPVKPTELFLFNNNVDGSEPELLFHKIGNDVVHSTNFPTFYNMQISESSPYITKKSSGGKRKRTRKNKKSKKSKKSKKYLKNKK
jgi:predicted kinase